MYNNVYTCLQVWVSNYLCICICYVSVIAIANVSAFIIMIIYTLLFIKFSIFHIIYYLVNL